MPRKVMDYSKVVIYKIVCNDLAVTEVYVGHTTNWTQRKKNHKNCCSCSSNSKQYNILLYKTIREHGGWDNWTMVEVEKYPCNGVGEATARERYWFEFFNSKLNIQVPARSSKEYYQSKREHILEYQKAYNKKNDAEIKEKQRIYRGTEKSQQYQREYQKKYREAKKNAVKGQDALAEALNNS